MVNSADIRNGFVDRFLTQHISNHNFFNTQLLQERNLIVAENQRPN